MALSLDVSSADVAYRESLGEKVWLPRDSKERRMQASRGGLQDGLAL